MGGLNDGGIVKIAFGSCARYSRRRGNNQTVWDDIAHAKPDYLFLLGDQIYMDYGYWPFSREYVGKPKGYDLVRFEEEMCQRYTRQWNEPHFAALRNDLQKRHGKNRIFGVWDDHDFAWDGAQGEDMAADPAQQGKRDISRALFHQWMNCSTNRPEVYYSLDIPGARVIFLDNRYHAKKGVSLLGQAQLNFLQQALQHDAAYTLVCAGLTLTQGSEKFSKSADYPALMKILTANPEQKILFLAGDIHNNYFGTISEQDCPPVHEIVSSGLHINYLGLPGRLDDRRNWGLLTLDNQGVTVELKSNSKKGRQGHRINLSDWNNPICL